MTEVDTKKDTYVIVSKNGLVTWVPPIIVYSHCILNFENYPFDKQYCRITFGSWNHDGTIIDLQTDKEADVTRRLLNRNFKWKVIHVNVTREVAHYDCCEEPYVAIIYNFSVERRESVHQRVVSIPNILTLMITLMTFWLPPETIQKLAISSMMMMILTGLLIYLTFSIKSLPAISSAVTLVHRSMILIFINMVIELFVINLSRASIHFNPPSFINNRLSGLFGIILCIPPEMQCSESLREFHSFGMEEENVVYKQHPRKGNWRRVAIAIDRISFILFIPIVLIVTYNNS
ncbi:neuronal acetylcholine receptor subunit alpha-6-like [Centruroides sculpturatus]|uniref:neuronal acetylcholine receptor subunit alpha-6-like n=1 Tax=Centruroides sculpturatus TaxID=218467 RepID=UPI000C6D44A2|nr:neuronal acetylcholine receptor subunit alpha-6-like [Centruroides sculpturatus]